jgi:hypothetical protein
LQINEDEARLILGAIHCAEFKMGEFPNSVRLVTRIHSEFPGVVRGTRERSKREYLWSVLAEQDPRVIEARMKLEITDINDPAYDEYEQSFLTVKAVVNKELLAKAGLR